MADKFVFREMEFRAGAHLWSNPKLRGTPAEIPIILARPTLFDVVKLAQQYPLEALHLANRQLRVSREISERQYLRTDALLRNIGRNNAGHPATIEEVARVIEMDAELPVPVRPCPRADRTDLALSTQQFTSCRISQYLFSREHGLRLRSLSRLSDNMHRTITLPTVYLLISALAKASMCTFVRDTFRALSMTFDAGAPIGTTQTICVP